LLNILTIDFEEWYHPEYVKDKCPEDKLDNAPQDLSETLNLLEKHKLDATFFVVGEIAQRNPALMNQISQRGHEVGFHGFDHEPLWNKSAERLRLEANKFQTMLGSKCIGFRAPSFSLNNNTRWALDVLTESGFKYDSSIFPMNTPLYGVKHAPTRPYKPSHGDVSIEDQETTLWEFPLHVYSTSLLRLPMAGGFYLRFFPLRLIKKSIQKANKEGRPAVLFVHTWELNPQMPKLRLGLYKSFVTYHNLEKATSKLEQLFSQFEFTSVRNYMKEKGLI
jgi:polysaccharide deacetylase family protein (PEP-CTERM system associated)